MFIPVLYKFVRFFACKKCACATYFCFATIIQNRRIVVFCVLTKIKNRHKKIYEEFKKVSFMFIMCVLHDCGECCFCCRVYVYPN